MLSCYTTCMCYDSRSNLMICCGVTESVQRMTAPHFGAHFGKIFAGVWMLLPGDSPESKE